MILHLTVFFVVPAEAGIQVLYEAALGPRLRGDDDSVQG